MLLVDISLSTCLFLFSSCHPVYPCLFLSLSMILHVVLVLLLCRLAISVRWWQWLVCRTVRTCWWTDLWGMHRGISSIFKNWEHSSPCLRWLTHAILLTNEINTRYIINQRCLPVFLADSITCYLTDLLTDTDSDFDSPSLSGRHSLRHGQKIHYFWPCSSARWNHWPSRTRGSDFTNHERFAEIGSYAIAHRR